VRTVVWEDGGGNPASYPIQLEIDGMGSDGLYTEKKFFFTVDHPARYNCDAEPRRVDRQVQCPPQVERENSR
ncbi:hypothetical protein C2E25_13615, partial [Geothermobacter hydrogeniphilus]